MSGTTEGIDVDVRVANGTAAREDGGVEYGDLLHRYAHAVIVDRTDLDDARASCAEALGEAKTAHAAGVIAAFDGINRVADGTGIHLDRSMYEGGGQQIMETLGLTNTRGEPN